MLRLRPNLYIWCQRRSQTWSPPILPESISFCRTRCHINVINMISYPYFSLTLFADEIILYIKDCKDSTTYHLYLINSFSKDSLLKIDTKVNSNPVYNERNQGNYCIHSRFPRFLSVCLYIYKILKGCIPLTLWKT